MQSIHTNKAPEAIGTYSQAIRTGNTVYLSGQIPLDPQTMQLCSDDIRLQITQVFENLSVVCHAAGGDLSHLVKLTIYLTDLTHFSLVNDVMTSYFSAPYPARAVVGISSLPKGSLVEMEGVMVIE